MSHIFVSYDSRNQEFALRLAGNLERWYKVWIDREGLTGGHEYEQMIDKAIRDCRVFIVVVSPASNESAWVARETIHAERCKKHRIPILVDGELPLRLLDLQYIDFRGDYEGGLQDLLEVLQTYVDPEARIQEEIKYLIGDGVIAHLSGHHPKANHLIGQALTLNPELANTVEDFWACLRTTEQTNFADSLMDKIRVVEHTRITTSVKYPDDRTAYEWRLGLDAPDEVLDQIDHVLYELHPTFRPPAQVVRARDTHFRLTRIGWGPFLVTIKVNFKDNTIGRTEYLLKFETD